MAEDWSADVRRYAPDADPAIVAGIVRHCGIALQSRDASLVSFSDPAETGRVRENFLKKKLGLTASDADLDGAIAAVGERMKADRTKNRVTVYYLLAAHFGKLPIFAKTPAAGDAPIAGQVEIPGGTAALGVAGLAAGGAAVAGGSAGSRSPDSIPPSTSAGAASRGTAQAFAEERNVGAPVAGSAGIRWLPWLLLAAGLLVLLLYLILHRQSPPAPGNATAVTSTAAVAPETPDAAVPAAPAAIPTGAGVTTELRDGKPAVMVYFDTGKADVAPAFAPAATALKTYLDANSGSTLAISGYNDKTGNAAVNAALSKNRAQAVQAALVAADIPASAIALVKPSDTTDVGTTDAEARRVEVVVK